MTWTCSTPNWPPGRTPPTRTSGKSTGTSPPATPGSDSATSTQNVRSDALLATARWRARESGTEQRASLRGACACVVPMQRLMLSDELADIARAVHLEVTALLNRLDIPGTLELTGASSTPGALTKGDIDLHLRVEPGDFP